MVKAMSFAVTGVPSPHFIGFSATSVSMPCLPSGRVTIRAVFFSMLGSSTQTRQTRFQSGS